MLTKNKKFCIIFCMENTELLDKIANLNYDNMDFIEIAKDFCEFNCEKSAKLYGLIRLFDIVVENQRKISETLDGLY